MKVNMLEHESKETAQELGQIKTALDRATGEGVQAIATAREVAEMRLEDALSGWAFVRTVDLGIYSPLKRVVTSPYPEPIIEETADVGDSAVPLGDSEAPPSPTPKVSAAVSIKMPRNYCPAYCLSAFQPPSARTASSRSTAHSIPEALIVNSPHSKSSVGYQPLAL